MKHLVEWLELKHLECEVRGKIQQIVQILFYKKASKRLLWKTLYYICFCLVEISF